MSTQSIIHKNTESLLDNTDRLYICLADKYILNKKYGVKNNINLNDVK